MSTQAPSATPAAPSPASRAATSASLPGWLGQSEAYAPPQDRSSFAERNLEQIGATLGNVREGGAGKLGIADRQLARVNPAMRVLGLISLALCVGLSTNMLFIYILTAISLTLLAARPISLLKGILAPTLAVCAFSLLLSIPALAIGQWGSPVRLTAKAFVTVSFTIALARTLPWNRLIAGLRGLHCPHALIYVIDMTVQFIAILGVCLTSLLEALHLRSVGHDRTKLTSAGHLLGTLFLRTNDHAKQMSEAMICRGFDGTYQVPRQPIVTAANAWYGLLIIAMIASAIYLNMAVTV